MNAQTESLPVPAEIKLSRYTQWVRRHRKACNNFIIAISMIAGGLPGAIGLFFVLLIQGHPGALPPLHAIFWIIIAYAVLAFGTIFGALVANVVLAVEKFISPENFPSKQ